MQILRPGSGILCTYPGWMQEEASPRKIDGARNVGGTQNNHRPERIFRLHKLLLSLRGGICSVGGRINGITESRPKKTGKRGGENPYTSQRPNDMDFKAIKGKLLLH